MPFNKFDYKVNAVSMPTPKFYEIDFQPVTDSERLLDGTMDIDGVTDKVVLTFTHEKILSADLIKCMADTWAAYRTNRTKIRCTVTFPDYDDTPRTINAYWSPMKLKRSPESQAKGYWENYVMKFIEI